MLHERRAHHRVPTMLTVLWEGLLTDNHALMTDVSPGGCYINSAGRVSLDEQISVETDPPGAVDVKIGRAHV